MGKDSLHSRRQRTSPQRTLPVTVGLDQTYLHIFCGHLSALRGCPLTARASGPGSPSRPARAPLPRPSAVPSLSGRMAGLPVQTGRAFGLGPFFTPPASARPDVPQGRGSVESRHARRTKPWHEAQVVP